MSGYIVYNFCITLTCKGIEHFYRKSKILDDKEDSETAQYDVEDKMKKKLKAIVIYETNDKSEKLDEHQEKADKLVEAEAYSYLLFAALQYEIISIRKLIKRPFRQAVVILCEYINSNKPNLMPVLHPRVVLTLTQ
mmetsp:Transcript_41936/g.48552  ORF Transcript_41936/g.48552 Transcript_41936/m.48552 type:complete len:136 (-) Transcript_41936:29-436(-)